MKKCLLILTTVLIFNSTYSQVLYTENFDNLSIGNLGTDPSGAIPGQGGWYTVSQYTQANSFFNIVNETGRGKVLDMTTGVTDYEYLVAIKKISHTTIANRLPGNDVFMLEIDYYTGSNQPRGGNSVGSQINILSYFDGDPLNETHLLSQFSFDKSNGDVGLGKLPFNTWVKIIFYLDYPNEKKYLHIPYLNDAFSADIPKHPTSTNLIEEYPISEINLIGSYAGTGTNPVLSYIRNRYDNIKLTAINEVPPEVVTLSVNEQLAEKFNLYPNPASNVVNITNNENMFVKEVAVYDTKGKLISTQNFNEQTEIQLNVENLASGTYMLHLQTAEGTAVKKLVKK
ncbi:T9SS type A sorting domain-containing protein [Flavobacterium dauae]|uniref:T9SS type A sorting domain-containing protein n=1 Tax=Flavobacterium dauae TaxID=1563479 RepID=UPI00101B28F1|nr:T9SS type A sorting domain-containing protein [Flavobacterium dauae]WLD23628.1 T9SS type A sorting domain-containing protein [Flavobacterium dauae]